MYGEWWGWWIEWVENWRKCKSLNKQVRNRNNKNKISFFHSNFYFIMSTVNYENFYQCFCVIKMDTFTEPNGIVWSTKNKKQKKLFFFLSKIELFVEKAKDEIKWSRLSVHYKKCFTKILNVNTQNRCSQNQIKKKKIENF